MIDPVVITNTVIERLTNVIDPETGVDVVRMRLVRDLRIDENGKASYIFRPSSPVCPIAVPLALAIIQMVGETPGVTGQQMTVVDYIQADELNEIIKAVLE